MKYFLFFLATIFIVFSCKKSGEIAQEYPNGIGLVPPSDAIPPATPIITSSRVFIEGGTENYNINSGSNLLAYREGGYDVRNMNSEKYYTYFKIQPTTSSTIFDIMGFEQSKVVTLTSTVKNYVELKPPVFSAVGYTVYDYGTGTFALPNNGSIYIPPNTYTPSLGGSVIFHLIANYFNPIKGDYALTMPALFTDFNNKRVFLESYGGYIILARASDYTGYNIDFKSNAGVKITMPIPSDLLVSAPDSISVWNFNSNNNTGKWEQNGYARKNVNVYEKIITKKGYWNFAMPVDGLYFTLHLRTKSDTLAIKNTRFKIQSGNSEVADGRTDNEGNAIVFVPKNKDLQIEIRDDHYQSWSQVPGTITNLGILTNSIEKTIQIADRPDIAVVEGNVYDCNGLAFNNGYAMLSRTVASARKMDNYNIPITGGKFKFCEWIYFGGQYWLDINDNINNQLSRTNLLISIADQPPPPNNTSFYSYQNISFFSCSNAGKLFSNLKIDATPNNFISDINETNSKVICDYSHANTIYDKITILNNGLPISFVGSFTTGYHALYNMSLIVNGIDCTYDWNNGSNEILISRMDPNAGGIVEGWYSIHYRDNGNVFHTLKGNFRAKRIG